MKFYFQLLLAAVLATAVDAAAESPAGQGPEPGKRTVRLVQDDAQDYMVSKIFTLKYAQSNDVMPFVMSMVRRYNMNSIVNCIEYGNDNQQILTVTCPVGMMPYVDDFIAKVDRPIRLDGKIPGEIIRGTGITRAVYQPKYRSGQTLVNTIVNAFINAGPYGSVYGWDSNSNQIYWKDNTSNSEFVYQFLGFLDRPAPQLSLVFTLYEVRESTLRDLGIEYLAWKNGPGLDLLQVGWRAFDLSSSGSAALQSLSGPLGGFFFAPQFDASFIRLLEQGGHATVTGTARMTVSNSDSRTYGIRFQPQFQNLVKSDNDQTSVVPGSLSQGETPQLQLQITAPVASLHSGAEVDFEVPDYAPGQYAAVPGTLCFGYGITAADAVERNNYGAELVETTSISGNVTMDLNREWTLAVWETSRQVRQTIGIPFLCEIPVLKYLFSTTTTSEEKTRLCLTVTAEVINTAVSSEIAGQLVKLK